MFDRRTSDSKKKERKNQPVSRYSRTWVRSKRCFFTINRVKLGLGTVMLFCVQTGVGRFGDERNVDLCYAARRAKAVKETISNGTGS